MEDMVNLVKKNLVQFNMLIHYKWKKKLEIPYYKI